LDCDRFTVRKIRHPDGQISYWIFTPDSDVHRPSLKLLGKYTAATQQTYAYSLVDHLNWVHANGKTPEAVTLQDLQRYMKGLTGQAEGVYGLAWRRPGQAAIGASAAGNVATIVKAYYVHLAAAGTVVDSGLIDALSGGTAGHGFNRKGRSLEANPLSPKRGATRPRFLSDDVVQALFEPGVLTTARDIMIVTWLHDGGLRVGGLCGLRFSDLHLVHHHPCGQRQDPHIHIVGRDDNPNGARAKNYSRCDEHLSKDGYIVNGTIRAVSPDMISTLHSYLLDEFHLVQHLVDHEQVLVHGRGPTPAAPLTTNGVRKMLQRACQRAGLGVRVLPHAFRHKAAAALYAESDFNAELVAQEFGWSSPAMVTDLYGKSANRHAMKFLAQAWESTARPPAERHLHPTSPEVAER